MTDLPPLDIPQIDIPGDEGPSIWVVAQFIRDLSFENPRAPESLQGGTKPNVEMGVELGARGRVDGLFELDLKLNITSTNDGEIQFQIELVYGGLFEIKGVPAEQLEVLMLVECPRFLFPFARRIIADLTMDGGFPPFMMEPIDFGAVYIAQRQAPGGIPDGSVGNA